MVDFQLTALDYLIALESWVLLYQVPAFGHCGTRTYNAMSEKIWLVEDAGSPGV